VAASDRPNLTKSNWYRATPLKLKRDSLDEMKVLALAFHASRFSITTQWYIPETRNEMNKHKRTSPNKATANRRDFLTARNSMMTNFQSFWYFLMVQREKSPIRTNGQFYVPRSILCPANIFEWTRWSEVGFAWSMSDGFGTLIGYLVTTVDMAAKERRLGGNNRQLTHRADDCPSHNGALGAKSIATPWVWDWP
jgi:hypothetical protein